MAGGGALMREGGIDPVTIAQVGTTIEMNPRFIARSQEAGGMTTGNINGEDISGMLNRYLTLKFKLTGKTGKKLNTGRPKIPGASRAYGIDSPGKFKRLDRSTEITAIAVTGITESTDNEARL